MRNFVVFAIIALAAALGVQRFAEKVGESPAPPSAMTAAPATAASGRTLTVRPDRSGHYNVEGRIDGRRMGFVVDTGATVIAIPEREAARLGIHPAQRDYTVQIKTANGTVRAAPTRLAMVEVGNIVVRDVAAVVMPNEALAENLLGMSFLSRLRRFEFADGRLVMEP